MLLEDRERRVPPRSFSIANAPRQDGLILLLANRVPVGETSTWVHEWLRFGVEVSVSGPYGTFVDDPTSKGGRFVSGRRLGAGADPRAARGRHGHQRALLADTDLLRATVADVSTATASWPGSRITRRSLHPNLDRGHRTATPVAA